MRWERTGRLALAAGGALAAWKLARWARRRPVAGEVVLITGGSRGLGLVLARELAGRGARLVLCARDPAELERARRELAGAGADVLAVPCDVTDPTQLIRLVEAAEERYGRVDALVNVAGIIQVGPYETLSLEDYRSAMAANFWGTVHATLAVLPGMRARRRGRILNVTSIGGVVAVPHLLAYTASKFAAVGFSSGLAAEAARHGVSVTTVVPGLMRTGSFIQALFKGRREEEMSAFSVAASLPVLTVGAERAARRMADALERRERFVTVGVPWKAVRLGAALAPGLATAALSLVSAALPDAGGAAPDQPASPGYLHRQGLARSGLTRLSDLAADRNNERPGA